MLQARYGSVGGEVKVGVRIGMVPGKFESGEAEPERGVDVFGWPGGLSLQHPDGAPGA